MEESHPTKLPILIVGVVLGILLSATLLFVKIIFFDSPKQPATNITPALKLDLDSPRENLATSSKTLKISGSTGIKSIVTVSLGTQQKVVNADSRTFTVNFDLSVGKNSLTVTAFDPQTGNTSTLSRTILYLAEGLDL